MLLFVTTSLAKANVHLTNEEQIFLKNSPVIKVHMEENYAPFSFRDSDGEFTGFSIEYADLIAKKLGIKFEYSKDESWSEALERLKSGDIGIVAQMIKTKQREEFANFTKEYMRYFVSLLVKTENSNLDSLDHYDGKTIGVVDGYATADILRKKFPKINLKTFKDIRNLVNAVIRSDVDAALATHQVVQYDILSRFISDVVSIPLLEDPRMPIVRESFGVRKDLPLLVSAMQKAMDSLALEKSQLQTKWFGSDPAVKTSIELTAQEIEFLQTSTVKYCIDPNWEPFEYYDEEGKHNGITKDYLDLLKSKIRIKTKLIKTSSWSQTIEYLKQRKCDMIMGLGVTPSRKNYLTFTKPYLKFPQVVAMRSDVAFISGFEDIKDKKVGVIKDYAITEILKLQHPDFKPVEVSSVVEGLKKVADNKLDAFVDFLPSISRGINIVASGNLKIAGQIKEKVDLSAGSRSDNSVLSSILQKAVISFKEEEHKAILDKWMTIKYEYGTDYTVVYRVVIVAFLFILLIAYFYLKIKKANRIIEKQNKELEILAITDKLTGLYNRRYFDDILPTIINSAKRNNKIVSFLMIDIDHFKPYNDNYGHQMGDEVLMAFSRCLQNTLKRANDMAFRLGGEEFGIVYFDDTKEKSIQFANQVRQNIQNLKIPHEFTTVEEKVITVSMGLVCEHASKITDIEAVYKQADDLMYKSKESGRNKVSVNS